MTHRNRINWPAKVLEIPKEEDNKKYKVHLYGVNQQILLPEKCLANFQENYPQFGPPSSNEGIVVVVVDVVDVVVGGGGGGGGGGCGGVGIYSASCCYFCFFCFFCCCCCLCCIFLPSVLH